MYTARIRASGDLAGELKESSQSTFDKLMQVVMNSTTVEKCFKGIEMQAGQLFDELQISLSKQENKLASFALQQLKIHWPIRVKKGTNIKPENFLLPDIYIYTYYMGAMENLHDMGKARAIGMSNFSTKKLEDLIATAWVPPSSQSGGMSPWLETGQALSIVSTERSSPLCIFLAWFTWYNMDQRQQYPHKLNCKFGCIWRNI